MKTARALSIMVCFFLAGSVFGQCGWPSFIYDITFEDSLTSFVHINNLSDTDDVWQIGLPQKVAFNAAYSGTHVIVTDTTDSYPPNDTSEFIVYHLAMDGWGTPAHVVLGGNYWVDSDSVSDFGKIEVSFRPDSGWLDLIDPQWSVGPYWVDGIYPTLSGRSMGWKYFLLNHAGLRDTLIALAGITLQFCDTVYYRFTFISDSIDTHRDGLMFDDLHFEDWSQGIQEYVSSNFHSSASPDPTDGLITLTYETANIGALKLVICDPMGRPVISIAHVPYHRDELDVSGLAAGIYLYELVSDDGAHRSIGRFVKR